MKNLKMVPVKHKNAKYIVHVIPTVAYQPVNLCTKRMLPNKIS